MTDSFSCRAIDENDLAGRGDGVAVGAEKEKGVRYPFPVKCMGLRSGMLHARFIA
jgi:hypothetical protein